MNEFFLIVIISLGGESGIIPFGPFDGELACEEALFNEQLISDNVKYLTQGQGELVYPVGCFNEEEVFDLLEGS